MAKWCHPRVSTLYRDAFMGHESWRVRTAYVQAHSDDEPTAARAAKDAHPRVRAALAAVKPDANGLADDTSYLVRKAVAAHTTDPAVLSRLAHDNDARVQRVAARRVVDLMARA
jgi:hypothetical protein